MFCDAKKTFRKHLSLELVNVSHQTKACWKSIRQKEEEEVNSV